MSWHFFFRALATDLPLEEIVDEVKDFDERFRIILHKHLAVLGWWSIINTLTGIVGLFLFTGFWWCFCLMNLCWGLINFVIVLTIYDHTFYKRYQKSSTFQRFEVQRHMEKMLWLNIGLDLAYIFAGLYIMTLGRVPEIPYAELWQGFGWSVLIQGTYLFVQDHIIHYLHYLNFRKSRPFLQQLLRQGLNIKRETVE